jgi:hypothetical protein
MRPQMLVIEPGQPDGLAAGRSASAVIALDEVGGIDHAFVVYASIDPGNLVRWAGRKGALPRHGACVIRANG